MTGHEAPRAGARGSGAHGGTDDGARQALAAAGAACATDAGSATPEPMALDLLDRLPLAVMVLLGDVIRYANPAAFALLGVSTLPALSARIAAMEHVPEEQRVELRERRRRFHDGEEPDGSLSYWTIVRPDGSERRVEWQVLPVGIGGHRARLLCATDITETERATAALAASEARLRNLANSVPVGIFETDAVGQLVDVNPCWCRLSGFRVAQAQGLSWVSAIHPQDQQPVLDAWVQRGPVGQALVTEFRYLHPDGRSTPVHLELRPMRDDAGSLTGWLGTCSDLSGEVALRNALAESESRFRDLAEHSPDVVMRIGIDPFRFDYVSPSVFTLTGSTPEQLYEDPALLGRHLHQEESDLIWAGIQRGDVVEHLELRIVHRDGTVRVVDVRATVVRENGQVVGVEATARDMTAAVNNRDRLDRLAHHDPLTGLLNRRALLEQLGMRLERGEATAVLFLDLDGFKAVNDEHGHEAGDVVLLEVALRLSSSLRGGDLVARLAGDEFVIVADPIAAESIAARVTRRLREPVPLGSAGVATVGVSIGITCVEEAAREHGGPLAEQVLRRADEGMYEAKRQGKGRVVVR